MPLNISKATATEYNFVLGKIPSDSDAHAVDTLRLNIFGINLPSINLQNTNFNWQGKYVQYHIGGITFDPLNVNFLVDSNFKNWKTLFQWITFIANNKDKPSMKPNDYVTDANLIVMDNFGTITTNIVYRNVWIQNLGELSFSTREGESLIESSAVFQYDRYELIGDE